MIIDVETHLIRADLPAPPIVCMQWGDAGNERMQAPPSFEQAREILRGPCEGANLKFDMGCLGKRWPDLRALTMQGRRWCTQIAAMAADIESGFAPFHPSYSLATLAWRYLRTDIRGQKNDPTGWRLRYSELDGVPLAEWPAAAREYALADVTLESRVRDYQGANMSANVRQHVPRLTTASIALHHASVRGIRLDMDLLREIEANAREQCERSEKLVLLAGWAERDKDDGHVKVKQARLRAEIVEAFRRKGEDAPHTPPSKPDAKGRVRFPAGQVKIDEETLIRSGHPILLAWAASSGARKTSQAFTSKWLARGHARIHPEYDLPKETGRVSCYAPNIQQLPRPTRDNATHGGRLREALLPEPGYVFVWADYAQIELCAVAQLCLWRGYGDNLARLINGGADVHWLLAQLLLDTKATYDEHDETHANARQDAKAGNYGLPGGLGANGLCAAAASQRRELSRARADAIIAAHKILLPDVREYVVQSIRHWKYASPYAEIPSPDGLPMRRLAVKATQACNTPFQGLVAAGALSAFVELSLEAEAEGGAWWPSLFVHDEIVCQARADDAPRVKALLEKTMVSAMRRYIPDVFVGVAGKAGPRWTKKK